ncbi:hypothetical protein MIR68_004768 [Amoeboaphelidium protococcarum]|nr:hypothetical protein MIR68_004768 [Amoeboaphelidium protococcarum]
MLNGVQFGNFLQLCNEALLPACSLFFYNSTEALLGQQQQTDNTTQATLSDQPNTLISARSLQCELKTFQINSNSYRNLGDVAISAISALLVLVMVYRAFTKYAAVGRKEMNLLFGWYFVTMCLQVITTGGFLLTESINQIISGIQIGFIVGTFWILMLNGAVGYQLVEDGSPLSFFSILLSGAAITAGVSIIALDAASSVRLLGGSLSSGTDSIALFVVYLLLPIVFTLIYVILQTVLVAKNLGEQKPLINLYVALLFIILSQVMMFVLNVTICQGTSGNVDGTMFATLCNLAAIIFVYRFWDSITEDDWDNVDDIFV